MGFKFFWKLADEVDKKPATGKRSHLVAPSTHTDNDWLIFDFYNFILCATESAGCHASLIEHQVRQKTRALLRCGAKICIVIDGPPGFDKARTSIDRFRQRIEANAAKQDFIIDGDRLNFILAKTVFNEELALVNPVTFEENQREAWLNSDSSIIVFVAPEEADPEVRKFIRHKASLNKGATFTIVSGDASLAMGIDFADRVHLCSPLFMTIKTSGDKHVSLECDRVSVAQVLEVLHSRGGRYECYGVSSLEPLDSIAATFVVALVDRDSFAPRSNVRGEFNVTHFGATIDFALKFWSYPQVEVLNSYNGRIEKKFDFLGHVFCASRIIRRLWKKHKEGPLFANPVANAEAIFRLLLTHFGTFVSSHPGKLFPSDLLLEMPKVGTWPLFKERETIAAQLTPAKISEFAKALAKRVWLQLDVVGFTGPLLDLEKSLCLQYDALHFSPRTGVPELERLTGPLRSLVDQVDEIRSVAASASASASELPPPPPPLELELAGAGAGALSSAEGFDAFFASLLRRLQPTEPPALTASESRCFLLQVRSLSHVGRSGRLVLTKESLANPSLTVEHIDGAVVTISDESRAVVLISRNQCPYTRCSDGDANGLYENSSNPGCNLLRLDKRATFLSALSSSSAPRPSLPGMLGLPDLECSDCIGRLESVWEALVPDDEARAHFVGPEAATLIVSLAYSFLAAFKTSKAALEFGRSADLADALVHALLLSPLFSQRCFTACEGGNGSPSKYNADLATQLGPEPEQGFRTPGVLTALLEESLALLVRLAGGLGAHALRWWDGLGVLTVLSLSIAGPSSRRGRGVLEAALALLGIRDKAAADKLKLLRKESDAIIVFLLQHTDRPAYEKKLAKALEGASQVDLLESWDE